MPFDAALPTIIARTVASAPRPWLSRLRGECAFPVDGRGIGVRSCCNPSGAARYCPAHSAIMRGPRARSPGDMMRDLRRIVG